MAQRIHIFGASGSGTTTLGQALARELGVPVLDTDAYFWLPSTPPFQTIRPSEQRLDRLRRAMKRHPAWVSSGSLCGWGDPLAVYFDRVVYLFLEQEIRMMRLARRERERYGAETLAPGGAMYDQHRAFMAWAAGYDAGGPDMGSRVCHEAWIQTLSCPVLQLNSMVSVEENLAAVRKRIGREDWDA